MRNAMLALVALLPLAARAQVGIGTTTPDAKAALDIRASDKGLLVPRLTQAQRTAIPNPPQGLMVYQTDGTASGGPQTGFWYYAGAGGWVFIEPGAGAGLSLPYSGTASSAGSVFQITNSGAGIGLRGASASGQGVVGRVNGTGAGQGVVGVKGASVPNVEDAGVVGLSDADYGVYGSSFQATAVFGTTNGTGTGVAGVAGRATGAGLGVLGESNTGTGVQGFSTGGAGVLGTSQANVNTLAGVVGVGTGGGAAVGVLGTTTNGYGVRGVASANGGYGVMGIGVDSYGVTGTSTSGVGTYGKSTSNFGLRGASNSNSGVYGETAAGTSGVAGVEGISTSSSGTGVLGTATAGTGVRGDASTGIGVRGEATGANGYGVLGTAGGANAYGLVGTSTGAASGLLGVASGTGRAGFFNQNNTGTTTPAVEIVKSGTGRSLSVAGGDTTTVVTSTATNNPFALKLHRQRNDFRGVGIYFSDNSTRSNPDRYWTMTAYPDDYGDGLSGQIAWRFNDGLNLPNGNNVPDMSISYPYGLYVFSGIETSGRLRVTNQGLSEIRGNLNVLGTLYKGGGSFKIDHPLDPANQYLSHSFVESPDMMNVYNGNVTLDARGEATVQLPDYFQALNRDFRYQLTAVGTPGPNLFVAEKVADNRFRIGGGTPGAEVSWQVTGIRQDKWANQNRIPNAAPKEPENHGKYLHPAAFGLPETQGIGYQPEGPAASRPRPAH